MLAITRCGAHIDPALHLAGRYADRDIVAKAHDRRSCHRFDAARLAFCRLDLRDDLPAQPLRRITHQLEGLEAGTLHMHGREFGKGALLQLGKFPARIGCRSGIGRTHDGKDLELRR
ncbi:MAG: hypothetical protein Kow0032_01470 [Methyloligellaceae bacterium]